MKYGFVAVALVVSLFLNSTCRAEQPVLGSGNLTECLLWNPGSEAIKPEQSYDYGGNDDWFDQYPSPGSYEQNYWLVYVLRFLIVLESGSWRLESSPVSVPLVIALHSIAGSLLSEESVLNQVYALNETPVGEPSFLFSEPMDGTGEDKTSTSTSSGTQQKESKNGQKSARKRGFTERDSGNDGDGFDEEELQTKRIATQEAKSLSERLNHAVCAQDIGLVEALLDAGADPNSPWMNKYPIFAAINFFYGNEPICRLLLSRGADTEVTFHSHTPLFYLICMAQKDKSSTRYAPFVLALLEYGADCMVMDNNYSVFQGLLRFWWDDCENIRNMAVEQLKIKKIDWNKIQTRSGSTLINEIAQGVRCIDGYSLSVFKWMQSVGIDFDSAEDNGFLRGGLRQVRSPLGVLLSGSFTVNAIAKNKPVIWFLLNCGVNCFNGFNGMSAFIMLLHYHWDDCRNFRLLAFKNLGVDLNLVKVICMGTMIPSLSEYPDAFERFYTHGAPYYKESIEKTKESIKLHSMHWFSFFTRYELTYTYSAVLF